MSVKKLHFISKFFKKMLFKKTFLSSIIIISIGVLSSSSSSSTVQLYTSINFRGSMGVILAVHDLSSLFSGDSTSLQVFQLKPREFSNDSADADVRWQRLWKKFVGIERFNNSESIDAPILVDLFSFVRSLIFNRFGVLMRETKFPHIGPVCNTLVLSPHCGWWCRSMIRHAMAEANVPLCRLLREPSCLHALVANTNDNDVIVRDDLSNETTLVRFDGHTYEVNEPTRDELRTLPVFRPQLTSYAIGALIRMSNLSICILK